ncbi:MAG: thiamine phosphate synthase [candidate division WOR-3 bacterium]|nr:MAG: thiamine phosphate synthase [candidate division WOR-3 bacterium]
MHFLRIIDVNLNRLDESLKLIEDMARFYLVDRKLLSKTRKIRSMFLKLKQVLPMKAVIGARKSNIDLGRKAGFDSKSRENTTATILANLTRAKEASRTIEEILKASNFRLSNQMKEIRFQIYDLEKDMIVHVAKKFDPYLHAIIDERYLPIRDLDRVIRTLVTGGATMIQLRIKSLSDRIFLRIATKIRKAIEKSGTKFIVNNRTDIAAACNAHGVHLGQDDMTPQSARKIIGDAAIIGVSAHTLKQAKKAEKEGADYLGVGAIFPTATKDDATICGLHTLKRIARSVHVPVIGIGGVNDRNYKAILRAGAAGIAVASFLFEGNMKDRIRSLTAK